MGQSRGPWGLTWYQWAVIGAAWMGWGFDIFDALLFNYVAGNCVPTLTGKVLGSPEAREVTALWTGRLTSILLMGWAVGGIFFGWLADRVGRTRTLLFTIYYFSLGGFIGTLATVPASKYLGRKPMFGLYFTLSALALGMTFGFQMEPTTRLAMFFLIGLSIFGVFGSFTYYLPELFPTRLRATGSGFCYNVGRIITAAGPLLVGIVAQQGHTRAMEVLLYLTLVPICGLLLLPLVVETKGKSLEEEIARPEGAPPSTS